MIGGGWVVCRAMGVRGIHDNRKQTNKDAWTGRRKRTQIPSRENTEKKARKVQCNTNSIMMHM